MVTSLCRAGSSPSSGAVSDGLRGDNCGGLHREPRAPPGGRCRRCLHRAAARSSGHPGAVHRPKRVGGRLAPRSPAGAAADRPRGIASRRAGDHVAGVLESGAPGLIQALAGAAYRRGTEHRGRGTGGPGRRGGGRVRFGGHFRQRLADGLGPGRGCVSFAGPGAAHRASSCVRGRQSFAPVAKLAAHHPGRRRRQRNQREQRRRTALNSHWQVKTLVLGAGGLLGSEFIKLVPGAVGLTRSQLSVTDLTAVNGALSHYQPEVVFNCAAYNAVDGAEADQEAAYQVNAQGAFNVALACAQHGARLVHFSTNFVFSGTLDRPYRETDQVEPLSVYAKSKLEGEKLVSMVMPHALIIRTAALFGGTSSHDRLSFPERVLE